MAAGNESPVGAGTGLILGKFMPPTLGHQFLVDFGRHYARELHVLVCTRECEPIPGPLRWHWMQEMFPHPNVSLAHVTDDLPQEPKDHPQFWDIWRDLVNRHVPQGVDYVFACEDYGFPLADVLGAKYIPVDRARELVPISATAIRQDPIANWRFLPPCVRPYYVKRVCLFGPESTGKTTLASQLGRHYGTVWVGEHARPLLDHKDGVCDEADIPFIVRGQTAAEESLARQADRVLVCDTDPLLTCVWSDFLFGSCPQWLRDLARNRHYDLYLLMDIDVPWVDDGQRYLADSRSDFFARCKESLDALNRPYVTLSGGWQERFDQAVERIDRLLEAGPPAAQSERRG